MQVRPEFMVEAGDKTISATRYAIVGLKASDGLLLKSMIERAAQRLELLIDYAAAECSNWVFHCGPRPPSMLPDSASIEVCPIGEEKEQALRFPPRMSDLMDVLARLRMPSAEGWKHCNVQELAVMANGWVSSAGPPWMVQWLDDSRSLIYPAERRYQGQLPQTGMARCRQAVSADITAMAGKSFHSIEPWLWQLGIHSANAGLLPGLSPTDQLRLRTWPYLIARAPRPMRAIAAQLREQPQSLAELVASNLSDKQSVHALLNATHLAGFLVVEAHASRNSAAHGSNSVRSGMRAIVGAIRQKLGLAR